MGQSFMLAVFASLIVQVNASTATRVVKLLRVMIPLVGLLLPVLVLLTVTAATFAILHWRAEYGRIFDILEKKGLDWPHVGHHTSGDYYRGSYYRSRLLSASRWQGSSF
jgi:hypothetical protein